METPLLRTKLYIPPPRPELVPRPRLIERLNAGIHRKLTLVSAPAGFGKTTLVSEWVQTMCEATPPIAVAWLSLDESDNDVARFLVYVIAALQTLEADIAKGALSALHAPQPQLPPTEAILTALINEIAAIPDRIVLILDDYHLIEARPIHDALIFLLRHLPPQMHLVIATREDPSLSLARLRARGQLTELRATDLRFTSFEAAEFLNKVMGLDLSAEDITALENRTEGWIAGLQLAAISMRGRKDVSGFLQSFTGSHHFVLDYLVEEVLEQQSESAQTFLLYTSILGRLSGSLCDAVRFGQVKSPNRSDRAASSVGTASSSSGTADNGQAILEMLEHANLFIVPLDDERRWYHCHYLFADLLVQHLNQIQSEQLPILHRRASEWYEQNGFVDEATEHALRAQDYERAARLLQEYVDAIWNRGEHARLRNWLAGLPDELLFSKPQLCIYHALLLSASGQQDAADRWLQVAEQALEPSTDRTPDTLPPDQKDWLSDTDRIKLRGRLAAAQALVDSYQGDVPGIILHARQALEYLTEQDLAMRSLTAIALGDAYALKGDMTAAYQARLEAAETCRAAGSIFFCMVADLKLAVTLREQGRLQQTIEICQQQLLLANENGLSQIAVVGWLLAMWGETLAELDDLDGALDRAKKGVELTERGRDMAMLGSSYRCLVRGLFSRRDLAGAQEIIQKVERIDRESGASSWITNQIASWPARLCLVQNKLEAASQWTKERGVDVDRYPQLPHQMDFFLLFEYIVLARILIAQGRLDKAIGLLQYLLEAADAGERTTSMIEILMLQALAFQAGGDTTRAMAGLERALTFAEPGGFIRIFVDEGPPMARLLYEALTRGIAPDYVRRLLAAFPVAEPGQADSLKTQAPKSELVEPLSERELEVLHLLAEGLTNQEIASRLFLALNTVKAHSSNIYGKLGVHSRTQAVARARALGVLSST